MNKLEPTIQEWEDYLKSLNKDFYKHINDPVPTRRTAIVHNVMIPSDMEGNEILFAPNAILETIKLLKKESQNQTAA